jgi:hypothetical protein
LNGEIGAGAGIEGWVPGAAEALTDGPGSEDMDGAAHGADHGLGFEHIEFFLTGAESDGAHDLVVFYQRFANEDALEDLSACFGKGILRGFGDEDLVGLAVDHELPPALMNVLALGVGPDLEAPFLEQVDGGVHVTGNIEDQVFTGDPHEVLTDILDVIFDRVLAVSYADVLVDGRKTHGHGTASIHGGLVHHGHLESLFLGPVGCLSSGATGTKTTTNDQEVSTDFYGFKICHILFPP